MTTTGDAPTSSLAGLLSEAEALQDATIQLRRAIHQRPELGLQLPETQAAIVAALEGLPLDISLGQATTSVIARLRGGQPGPTILLRGDMDALQMPEQTGLPYASTYDNRMHACGHDAHVAMLAGAAKLLAAHQADIHGSVVFMFQPGEEGYAGAKVMLDEGLLDAWQDLPPVSAAFAIHQNPVYPSGTIRTRRGPLMASAASLSITVRGRGGHGSAPHIAVDPIPVACEIVLALQAFITRRINIFDPAVLTVTKIDAGTAFNVIPEDVRMAGTIRTLSQASMDAVTAGLQQVAEHVAAAHGCTVDATVTPVYPPTVNDAAFADFVLDTARDLLGADRVVEMRDPVMGAEDFSYVLQRVPGAMANLGTRPAGDGPAAGNHSNRMLIDEAAMPTGVATYAAVALRYGQTHA